MPSSSISLFPREALLEFDKKYFTNTKKENMTSLKRSADSNDGDDIDGALLSKRGNCVIMDIL
jgi:hypothetical protein